MIDRPVAEEGDADAVRAANARADAGADRVADARRDDAVGAEQADRAVIEMHRAAAAAAAAVELAVKLGEQDVGVHALGERMAVAAVRRGDPIRRGEMGAGADRHRLFADIKMQEARSLALAAGDLRRRLEFPQELHLLVERNQRLRIQALGKVAARTRQGSCLPARPSVSPVTSRLQRVLAVVRRDFYDNMIL